MMSGTSQFYFTAQQCFTARREHCLQQEWCRCFHHNAQGKHQLSLLVSPV